MLFKGQSEEVGNFEIATLLSQLGLKAVHLASGKDFTQRSPEMTKRLARALDLYKDNRLGEIFPLSPHGKEKAITSAVNRKRQALRSKVDRFGFDAVEKEFLAKLPTGARNAVARISLRYWVTLGYENLRWGVRCGSRKGLGKKTFSEFEVALRKEGLCFDMTLEEVEACFGPEPKESKK